MTCRTHTLDALRRADAEAKRNLRDAARAYRDAEAQAERCAYDLNRALHYGAGDVLAPIGDAIALMANDNEHGWDHCDVPRVVVAPI